MKSAQSMDNALNVTAVPNGETLQLPTNETSKVIYLEKVIVDSKKTKIMNSSTFPYMITITTEPLIPTHQPASWLEICLSNQIVPLHLE